MTPVQGTALDAWVPHRGAMRLIDRLTAVDDDHAVAEVDVPFDGLFVRDGAVPAWVGIEYMAQTIAAWAGRKAVAQGEPPAVGFLLGTRRYETRDGAFAAGTTLRVSATCELVAASGLGQFDCRIEDTDGQVLATAMVSVFSPPAGAAATDADDRGGDAVPSHPHATDGRPS